MTAKKHRKFKGFAALDRRGNLIWGTLRTSAEEARNIFDRYNPDPSGEGQGEVITEVEIYIKVDVR
ncbi:MAG: hypothetical protein GY761_16065 [Hyphomicrobiales bacterium]|nr:hypothetical protein [Hyphomicrobiales bacterium]